MHILRAIVIFFLLCLLFVPQPADGARKNGEPVSTGTRISADEGDRVTTEQLEPLAGEAIHWQVISSGGQMNGTAPNLRLSGTIGQTAVGGGSSQSYGLNDGFWQSFGDAEFMCGDANSSGSIDIDDIVFLIAYVFQGGLPPDPVEAGDVNCSGSIDIDDIVYLVAYVFQAGDDPCDPDGNGVPDC